MKFSSSTTIALCAVLALFALCATVEAEQFGYAISTLARFQGESGGFRISPRAQTESLEATSNALFLSSLYGLRNKISTGSIPEYIRGFRNSDGGYGSGPSSTVAETRHAVLAHAHLGFAVPEPTAVSNYIRSLIDPATSLFSPRAGAAGDIKSTAEALEILDILGEGKRGLNQVVGGLNTFLSGHVSTDGSTQHFSFANQDVTVASGNFYGIYIATRIDFEFDAPEQWAAFIARNQAPNGGFFADASRTAVTFASTAHSVSAIKFLQTVTEGSNFMSLINASNLRSFALSAPYDLESAYFAHLAVAHTDFFKENFKFYVGFKTNDGSVPPENTIVEGSQIRPELTVRAFSGASHVGLNAAVQATFDDGQTAVVDLGFDQSLQQYVGDRYIVVDTLGPVSFVYRMQLNVRGVGDIVFSVSTEKSVGYEIVVNAQAVHDVTNQEVEVGKEVTVGTSFTFDVALSSKTQESITWGAFNLVFNVLDSSNVAIHREQIVGAANEAPLQFQYTLSEATIPAGDLSFAFQVQGDNGKVHSLSSVKYRVASPMVASDITVKGVSADAALVFELGSDVSITMTPASYSDLRTPTAFSATDYAGANVLASRSFFLDAVSPKGTVLRSVAGVPSGEGQYSFDFDVETTFDSLGVTEIAFRYTTAAGEDIVLQNYNSFHSELYDEAEPLSYTVNSELHLTEVAEQPTQGDFFYGNEITFKFEVIDKVSGEYLSRGNRGNVFLKLTNTDAALGGRTVTSVKVPAVEGDDASFVINWEINPNAVKGESQLVLAAEDADGNSVDLFEEDTQKAVTYPVNIGGDLDIESNSYSTDSFFSTQTAHVVEFSLSCNEKALRGANLRSSVVYGGEEIYSAPVAVSDNAYSVSWSTDHRDSPSGQYLVRVFREVDQNKAEESEEYKQKQMRQKQREVELSGGKFDAEAYLASLKTEEATDAEPLFEVNYYHKEVTRGNLPVKVEWVLIIGLVTAFVYASKRRASYE